MNNAESIVGPLIRISRHCNSPSSRIRKNSVTVLSDYSLAKRAILFVMCVVPIAVIAAHFGFGFRSVLAVGIAAIVTFFTSVIFVIDEARARRWSGLFWAIGMLLSGPIANATYFGYREWLRGRHPT